MKRTKRFLALLLSVLLLVSSVPVAAFADGGSQVISDVSAVLVIEPKGGETAKYNWTVPAQTAYGKVYDSEDYSCAWVKTSTRPTSFAELSSEGEWYYERQPMTFENGYYYTFVAYMQNADGYVFNTSIKGQVNGHDAYVYRQGDKRLKVWYSFYAADLSVKSVDLLGVQVPVAGETISYDYSLPKGVEGYGPYVSDKGISSYWAVTDEMPQSWDDIDNADGYTNLEAAAQYTFEGGKYYTFVGRVGSRFGYQLDNADATVNGEAANIRWLAPYYEVAATFYVEPKEEKPEVKPETPPTPSTDKKTTVTLYINKANYTVNDSTKISDSVPIIRDSRTFVPFRLVAEALGGEVQWIPNGQRIITILDDTTVRMQIGSKGYSVFNATKGEADGVMDVAPYINSANRTLVPLRFVAESLGCTVTPYYAADGTTERVVFEK